MLSSAVCNVPIRCHHSLLSHTKSRPATLHHKAMSLLMIANGRRATWRGDIQQRHGHATNWFGPCLRLLTIQANGTNQQQTRARNKPESAISTRLHNTSQWRERWNTRKEWGVKKWMPSVGNEWLLIELTAEILHRLYRSRELQTVMSNCATRRFILQYQLITIKQKQLQIFQPYSYLIWCSKINYIDG